MVGSPEPSAERIPVIDTSFEVVLWGYDRPQVHRCMAELEAHLAEMFGHRQRADEMAEKLSRAEAQIEMLRAQLAGVSPAVHQVGAQVQGIVELAEREAAAIRARAEAELAEARDDALRIRAGAEQRSAQARRDCDIALRARRLEDRRAADEMITNARAEAERIVAEARAAGTPAPAPEPAPAPAAPRRATRSAADRKPKTEPPVAEPPVTESPVTEPAAPEPAAGRPAAEPAGQPAEAGAKGGRRKAPAGLTWPPEKGEPSNGNGGPVAQPARATG